MRPHDPQKNELKPHLKKYWVIPPKQCAEFVCAMEEVLEVYQRPYDPLRPQVCFDETTKQLVGHVSPPLPPRAGRARREDYEYVRKGTANLFLFCEPLRGRRHLKVTDCRTKTDFAYAIRDLVDTHYPHAERIVLVMDNLNTHKTASLYEAFPPEEAQRIARKLEIHHTPKHGSWLNMAEIELSVLGNQCLHQRIPDKTMLIRETKAWERQRNQSRCKIDWRFTTPNARIKLKRLYPTIQFG